MKEEDIQSALDAGLCLQEAVILEYRRKARLDQHVVASCGGDLCKVPAEEALCNAEAAYLKKYDRDFEGQGKDK